MGWIFEPGIPSGAPVPEPNAFELIDRSRSAWLQGELAAADIDATAWTVHEWLYFSNNPPQPQAEAQLDELDAAFQPTGIKNNEIAHSWLLMAINNQYQPAYDRLYQCLTSIGRIKLVKPLYRELAKTPDGRVFVKRAFDVAKHGYHPLAIQPCEGYMLE